MGSTITSHQGQKTLSVLVLSSQLKVPPRSRWIFWSTWPGTLPLGCEVGDCRESVANPLATRSTYGYTLGMKTAVSIPNDLFEGAERLARRTRRSRSRLFSDALREYLAHHTPDNVTELMDKALGQIGAGKDTFVSSAGRRTLYEIEW